MSRWIDPHNRVENHITIAIPIKWVVRIGYYCIRGCPLHYTRIIHPSPVVIQPKPNLQLPGIAAIGLQIRAVSRIAPLPECFVLLDRQFVSIRFPHHGGRAEMIAEEIIHGILTAALYPQRNPVAASVVVERPRTDAQVGHRGQGC